MNFQKAAFAALIAVLFSLPAAAATLYVDPIFGANNVDCKKKSPCETIQHAVIQGGPGSRIILAPGSYYENLVITGDKIKITSVAGPMATEIVGLDDDAMLNAIIEVTGNQFTLGGKGKGVSVSRLDGPADLKGILVTGDKARIEGNIVNGNDFGLGMAPDIYDLTDSAIEVAGTRAVIRYNEVQSWNRGIVVNSPLAAAKSIISGNQVSGIGGTCIGVDSGDGSADRIDSNRIDFCNYDFDNPTDGIVLQYAGLEKNARPKVQKNLVQGVRNGITIVNAAPNVSRNLVRWTGKDENDTPEDGTGISLWGSVKGKVTNNLTFGTDNALYFDLASGSNIVTGNTMIFSDVGVKIEGISESPLKTFSKNNVDAFDCPVQTAGTMYTDPIAMKQNHWYFLALPDNTPDLSGAGCENANLAKTGGTLTFSQSRAEPNVVKFKSPI